MAASKVVLAYPYTDESGKDHKPDSTLSTDAETAALLIREGRARSVEADSEDVRAPKQSAQVDTTKGS